MVSVGAGEVVVGAGVVVVGAGVVVVGAGVVESVVGVVSVVLSVDKLLKSMVVPCPVAHTLNPAYPNLQSLLHSISTPCGNNNPCAGAFPLLYFTPFTVKKSYPVSTWYSRVVNCSARNVLNVQLSSPP